MNYRMCHPLHLNWVLKNPTLLTESPNCIQKNTDLKKFIHQSQLANKHT